MSEKTSKKQLLIGIALIGVSFFILAVIAYLLHAGYRRTMTEARRLQEEMVAVEAETVVARRTARELEKRVGREVVINSETAGQDVENLAEERERREGDLWIDRETGIWTVTLGLVNGVEEGHRLAVYQDDKRVGMVAVLDVFDVISHVRPVGLVENFDQDFYQVVLEE
ncbi:MAG: hypothetical protein ACLFPX_03765 [Candidatus Omnitrophota bacterium]